MKSYKELPCILYSKDKNDRTHIMTMLANIGKCQDISLENMASYSQLLAHCYHMMNESGASKEELEEAYQRYYRKNYCGVAMKNAAALRGYTDFYLEDTTSAVCLLCELDDSGNILRLEKESQILRALINRLIDANDISNNGGAVKIFASWMCVTGVDHTGLWPIVRLTYHLYGVISFLLLTHMGNEIDSREIATTFSQNHFDNFQRYGTLLHRETAEIAEAFYDAIIKLFEVKDEMNRTGCTKLLKELMDSSPSPARAKPAANAFKSTPKAETMPNITQEVLPKELTDAINAELNIQEPPINNERIFVPTLPKGLAARVKSQNPEANEPEIPTCSDTVSSRKETIVPLVSDESAYTESENPSNKDDSKSGNKAECNSLEAENAALANLCITDPTSETDGIDTSDTSDMGQSPVIMGAPAAGLKENDIAIETNSAKKIQSKETFYSLNDCKNMIVLNYFSLPSYEIAVHLYQKVSVEIGILYGIYGLIIFVPGANKLYFASYTYIIKGCIASSFHSNIDLFTTNISALECFLKRYKVDIRCKIHALNIYFQVKYMDKCSSISPENIIGHYNDLVIGDQTARLTAPDNLAKVIPFYYEIIQKILPLVSVKQKNKLNFWTDFERFLSGSYDQTSINRVIAAYKNQGYQVYVFPPVDNGVRRITLKAQTEDDYYNTFCYFCVSLFRTRISHIFQLRLLNLDKHNLMLEYLSGNQSDCIDALWSTFCQVYIKLFQKPCPDICIDVSDSTTCEPKVQDIPPHAESEDAMTENAS